MGNNGCATDSNIMNNGHNGCELLIWDGCRMVQQWVEQRLSPVVQWWVLEISNSHASANCAVVTASNGILFLLTNLLHYINPLFFKNGTVAKGAALL